MAVDTAAKRFSMLNFGDGTTIHLLFQSDGVVDADDRIHLLDLYNGFALAAQFIGMERTLFRRVQSRVFGRVN